MKNILLSIDFSEHAYNAAIYAAELAMQTKTRLILFHAYNPVQLTADEGTDRENFDTERDIQTKLDALALKLQALTGISITRLLKPGNLVNESLYVAKKIKADLILMGIEKLNQEMQPFLDEHTSDLVHRTEVPIMLIPSSAVFKPYKQVLLATDNEVLEHDLNNLKFLNKLFFRFMGVHFIKIQAIRNQQETVLSGQSLPADEKYAAGTHVIPDLEDSTKPQHPELFIASGILVDSIEQELSSKNEILREGIPLLLLPGISKTNSLFL